MPALQAKLSPARDEPTPPVCPRCRQPRSRNPSAPLKCPEHALAFVDVHELSAAEGDPLLGVSIAGRFTILGRLGRGSMGAVYRARQEAVGRDVALKIVRSDRAHDSETKARFEREARAISLLTSQHTITAFDFGEAEDGSWFLAMEMLEGESVGDRLRREGRIDWIDALRFAREALRSLAEAHSKGIVHRDLKPDNLFLARLPDTGGPRREICKVLDFGIAKWEQAGDGRIDQLETQAGTVFGTPRYMSPEQAQGNPLDARSDLYSLGVLLYQMLTGSPPFVDDDAVVVMARHIKDEPPPFAEFASSVSIPPRVEAAVRRALAKSPNDRPQTAEQMSFELEQALEETRAVASGVQPASAPPASGVARTRSRFTRYVLGGVFLGGAVVTAATMWLTRREPTLSAPTAPSHAPVTASVAPPVASEVAPPPATDKLRENYSPVAPAASLDVPSAPRAKRQRARPATSAALPRKGNERYGRFD